MRSLPDRVDEAPRQPYGMTLAVLATAALAYAVSQTMVAPALPAIQKDLHTTTTGVTWVLTIYLLTASIATPVLGRLGDMFGKERVLVVVLVGTVDPGETGVATGMNTIMRTVGGSLGAQISATIVSAKVLHGTHAPVESGYTAAFLLSSFVLLLAFGATLFVPVRAPVHTRVPA